MVTLSAILQSPIQALLRPSMWIPCFKGLHSHRERWQTDVNQAEFKVALVEAIEKVMQLEENTEYLDIHKIKDDDTFIRVFAFTRADWLDVVEIKLVDGLYEVCSFSSGLVPLIVPLACILNMVFFWVPFLDNNFNKRRLRRILEAISVTVEVIEKGKTSTSTLISQEGE